MHFHKTNWMFRCGSQCPKFSKLFFSAAGETNGVTRSWNIILSPVGTKCQVHHCANLTLHAQLVFLSWTFSQWLTVDKSIFKPLTAPWWWDVVQVITSMPAVMRIRTWVKLNTQAQVKSGFIQNGFCHFVKLCSNVNFSNEVLISNLWWKGRTCLLAAAHILAPNDNTSTRWPWHCLCTRREERWSVLDELSFLN